MSQTEFINELKRINITLTEKQISQLEIYYKLLIEENKKINLTAITKKEDVYLKHFYDSLTLIKIVDLNNEYSLCDIGTGAGFPGLVLKIVFPNLKVTLLDSLNKRINFLNKIIEKLDLKKIEVFHIRAEEYAKENRCKFDITTARAVSHLSNLLEYAIPMTKEGGYFIALKGDLKTELDESKHAIDELNVQVENIIEFNLPIENSNRTIIKFKKNKDNKKYPRKYSDIKKNRL